MCLDIYLFWFFLFEAFCMSQSQMSILFPRSFQPLQIIFQVLSLLFNSVLSILLFCLVEYYFLSSNLIICFYTSSSLLFNPSRVFYITVITSVWYFLIFYTPYVEVLTVLIHSSPKFSKDFMTIIQNFLPNRFLISVLFSFFFQQLCLVLSIWTCSSVFSFYLIHCVFLHVLDISTISSSLEDVVLFRKYL